MAMTSVEQNTLNQALNTAKTGTQVTAVQTQDGVNKYVLVNLVPIRSMTPAELTAFATIYSVTVASA
jgi:hypothetical protein